MKPADIFIRSVFYFRKDNKAKERVNTQISGPLPAWTADKRPLRAEGLITAPIFILGHAEGKSSLSAGNIKEVNGY